MHVLPDVAVVDLYAVRVWVLWAIATIRVGRLWRVAARWRRRQIAATEAS